MNKHFKRAAITKPDFLLISGIGGDRCYQTRRDELLGTRGFAFLFDQFEDVNVFAVCPADGIVTDVTEDCAQTWWEHHGEDATVPAIFERFLTDHISSVAETDVEGDRADAWRAEMRVA